MSTAMLPNPFPWQARTPLQNIRKILYLSIRQIEIMYIGGNYEENSYFNSIPDSGMLSVWMGDESRQTWCR